MFTRGLLQRLAKLDSRDPAAVKARLDVLEKVGLERFQLLGPGVRFRASTLLSKNSSSRLRAIEGLPESQRELARIAYLVRTRFGQALLPPVYDKRQEYHALLAALEWLGTARFKQIVAEGRPEMDLRSVPGLHQRHLDRQILAVRSAPLTLEQQQVAVAQVLERTAVGQHVLEFGAPPPLPEDAWEQAILALIGGRERFLEVYQQPPAFDVHSIPGVYDRSFAALVGKVQKMGLAAADEARAYVALLSYTPLGKRVLSDAGLPQPLQTVRGRPPRERKRRIAPTEKRPLQTHVDLLEHIGRDRFLQLVQGPEPLFDLEALDGWEHTGTSVQSRRRLIEQSALGAADKERALVALLAINPTPFRAEHHDLYRRIIRRTPQYRRGASGRASLYYFPKLLAEVGANRFVRLAREPLYDLDAILTAKDTGKWGINRKFERVRRSTLTDSEKERAYVSILARSWIGKEYLEDVAAREAGEAAEARDAAAAGEPPAGHKPKPKSKPFTMPAILRGEASAPPAAATHEPVPDRPKGLAEVRAESLAAAAGTSVDAKSESPASAVTRFAVLRAPFRDCDRRIRTMGSAAVAALPLPGCTAASAAAVQAAALFGLIVQAAMSL